MKSRLRFQHDLLFFHFFECRSHSRLCIVCLCLLLKTHCNDEHGKRTEYHMHYYYYLYEWLLTDNIQLYLFRILHNFFCTIIEMEFIT